MLSSRDALCIILSSILLLAGMSPAHAVKLFNKNKQKKAEKILAESYVPGDGWEAYFRDQDGLTKPVLQPVEVHSDKDWLGLTFTDYSGPRIRLAVMKVINKTPYAEDIGNRWGWIEVPLSGIEELLTTALYRTNRFDLVERKRVGVVLAEQDFGAGDRVSEVTAADIGELLGAQYLIYGTVNEWTPDRSRTGGTAGGVAGIAGSLAGGIAGSKQKAEVAMSFSVSDATSGQVLFQTTQRATAGSWSAGVLGIGSESSSPIGYAVQACVNKAAYDLAMWLKDRPWRGSVVKVDGGKVYINAGREEGMEPQTRLTVLSKGEELIDPETGLSLGAVLEAIGSLMVTAVDESYSTASVLEGCQGLEAGDRVQLAETASPSPPSAAPAPAAER